jgi:DNA polymerase
MPNVPFDGTLTGWRAAARALLAAGVAPDDAVWASAADAQGALALGGAGEVQPTYVPPFARVGATAPPRVPRRFLGLAAAVACHRDPERWTALYRVLWRLTLGGEPRLLAVSVDADVLRLTRMAKAVRRDVHKMHAFVRFRAAPAWDDDGDDAREYVAWFEPEHDVLAQAAAFFVRRFPNMRWAILTPRGTARWDGASLAFGPGVPAGAAPRDDSLEALWGVYYAHIFNPARLKPAAMRAEMPKKYWRNLPEAAAIPALVQTAAQRVVGMIEQEATMPAKRTPDAAIAAMWDQEPKSLAELNEIIRRAGPLVPGATQAVLGEGPEHADVVFVGEQPGDQEDLQGRPFVGPAGQLLTRAMGEAGISREQAYLTNAVKHFKFEQRGKRRIHSKPTAGEVKHYRPWLMKELELVRPRLVVALGATAVLALTGKQLPIIRARGQAQFGDHHGYITVHPSYLLRLADEETKQRGYEEFVADLARIRDLTKADPKTGELPLAAE